MLLFDSYGENVLNLPFVLVYLIIEGTEIGRYEENKWDDPKTIFSHTPCLLTGVRNMVESKDDIGAMNLNNLTKFVSIFRGPWEKTRWISYKGSIISD